MLLLRSIIFYIFWSLITLFIGVTCVWSIFLNNQKIVSGIGYIWSVITLRGLKLICGVTIKTKIKVKVPYNEAVIIASRHESTLDTLFFRCFFSNPAYIMKKELLFTPIFGQFIYFAKMVIINRSAGAGAIKSIVRQSAEIFNAQRPLIIFPEGTRLNYRQKAKVYPGIKALAKAYPNIPIYTVALNTGKCWSRNNLTIQPGVVTFEFNKIDDKESIIQELEEKMVEHSLKM